MRCGSGGSEAARARRPFPIFSKGLGPTRSRCERSVDLLQGGLQGLEGQPRPERQGFFPWAVQIAVQVMFDLVGQGFAGQPEAFPGEPTGPVTEADLGIPAGGEAGRIAQVGPFFPGREFPIVLSFYSRIGYS